MCRSLHKTSIVIRRENGQRWPVMPVIREELARQKLNLAELPESELLDLSDVCVPIMVY
jgi:hypothetical protein